MFKKKKTKTEPETQHRAKHEVESMLHPSSTGQGLHRAAGGHTTRASPLESVHPRTLSVILASFTLCSLWFDVRQRDDAQTYTAASGGGTGDRSELGMRLWIMSLSPKF